MMFLINKGYFSTYKFCAIVLYSVVIFESFEILNKICSVVLILITFCVFLNRHTY